MTSLVRPVLSSILCCMIAFGHAPAWLHVATCEGGCGEVAVSDAPSTTCSHGCCHHSSSAADSDKPIEDPDRPAEPADQHDSDTCALCQSLASSIGVVSVSTTTLAPEYVCEFLLVGTDQDPVVAPFSIAKPRGPPALA
ncbi:DUF2946 family protein [Novipirellula caenicola]|uniref:Uncharacterized protein n=1 Tax=Novipirellula caenicola TaxID=1536901 RepID=A0ABP9VPQ1_9BACT